ncbi:MAG: fumarate hydratase C-terminal domain-containing protein [Theionarchaea archaeon]|nr:fumarate hydratase C-terminal domain-containing protein [Theionarchaea archaeon]
MKTLVIPLKEEEIRGLKLGETVYLTGEFYTARDEAHMRALESLEEGKTLPVDFKDKAVFHCGPIMRKMNGEWELVAAGPTTSTRMNSLQPEFIEKLGPRAVIGKGGMGKDTLKAMEKYGCVYLAMTGGAAVLAAKGIKKVKGVEWLDLGMPEALWILVGENFGPLIVAMDAHGNSLFEDVDAQVRKNAEKIRKKLGLD